MFSSPTHVLLVASAALLLACGGGAPAPAKATVAASTAPASTPRATASTAAATSTPRAGGLRIESLLNGPTIEASLRIEAANPTAPAEITVTAKLAKPGVHPVHLHGGTCRAPGASVGFLGTLVPGQEGRATFQSSGVALPGSATSLTFEAIERNEVILDVHDPSGAVVACTELRRGSP